MEDFFPNYLKQNIRTIKLDKDKSKGQVVCSCGCEEFDYNNLFFKYIPFGDEKEMAKLQKLDNEMRENRIGPYKDYDPSDFRFHPSWTVGTIEGKGYWIKLAQHQTQKYNTIEELIQDPQYIGHVEMAHLDPTAPIGYEYCYVKCKNCEKEILLFDERCHGCEGVYMRCEQPDRAYRTDGKLKMKKPHCERAGYKIYVTIYSLGKEKLFEKTDEVITNENWKDAFEWIEVDIECAKCGKKKKVLNLETM